MFFRAALVCLAFAPAWGTAEACEPASPEATLACFTEAMTSLDIDAYSAILTEDFVVVVGESELSRGHDIETTRSLFEACRSLRFEISGDIAFEEADGAPDEAFDEKGDVHRVRDLTASMSLTTKKGETYDIETALVLIEVVGSPEDGYKIRLMEME